MKTNKKPGTKDIQKCVLEIFKEVKKICDEHNIRYFAIAGTAIGAIRHKGFIPWDDDIDIAMPRKDFIRFSRIASQELPAYYRVIDNTTDLRSQEMAMRISDERTAMFFSRALEKTDTFLFKGVALDIMPLDGVPSGKLAYFIHRTFLRLLYMLNAVANQTNKLRLRPRTITVIIAGKVLRLINRKGIIKRMFMRINAKYDFDDMKYLARTWLFTTHDGMVASARYHKDDFESYIEVPFEDTTMCVPIGYDRYLTLIYRDYMRLPPKSKRKPHYFDGIIDLNNSYKYYIAKEQGCVIGYTAGCYDMFHIGHLNILRRAKKQCNYLIVGINSDKLMYQYKNKAPIISEKERMEIVREMPYVDDVVLVDVQDKMVAYDRHKYDMIFVGSDHEGEQTWKDLEKDLAKKGSKVIYLSHTDGVSSTSIRQKIEKGTE